MAIKVESTPVSGGEDVSGATKTVVRIPTNTSSLTTSRNQPSPLNDDDEDGSLNCNRHR